MDKLISNFSPRTKILTFENVDKKVRIPSLIEIYWGLSTAKYSSASHSLFTGTPVLHFPDCSGKV